MSGPFQLRLAVPCPSVHLPLIREGAQECSARTFSPYHFFKPPNWIKFQKFVKASGIYLFFFCLSFLVVRSSDGCAGKYAAFDRFFFKSESLQPSHFLHDIRIRVKILLSRSGPEEIVKLEEIQSLFLKVFGKLPPPPTLHTSGIEQQSSTISRSYVSLRVGS